MLVAEAVRFLSQIPPFQFLDPETLHGLAGELSLEFHPKGAVILAQDGPAAAHLRLVQKGVVKITMRPEGGGDEVVVDYREPGEAFGLVSLLAGTQKTTIVALQDTLCYLVPKASLTELMASHPAVTEYLLQFHLNKYVGMTAREIQGKSLFLGSSDHLLFTAQVKELVRTAPTVVAPDTSIRATAQRMAADRQSAALVLAADGRPLGIVTDSDLRTKVVAAGLASDGPVAAIMSAPVVTMDEQDHGFEVVLRMLQGDIHHVAITRDGRLQGLVSNHDFMVLQGRSPLAFAEDIERQTTLAGLAPVSAKVLGIIGSLLREGARAANIVRIISELNDRVVRKVVAFAEAELGPPPVPYCWLGLGSEGRKEQTFRTDQDNALVYQDTETPEPAAEYFRRFAEYLRDGLVQCGFEACPAGYMASNPLWCQPLSVWKRYFSSWVAEPTPEAVLKSLIFFDFRPLAGSEALAWELAEHLDRLIPAYPAFIGFLANILVQNRPPISFFGAMAVERDGEHRSGLNLKIRAIAPLVDIARLFALEKGVRAAATWERLEALRGAQTLISDQIDDLEYAIEFITLLRIHHQFRQLEAGQPIDNFIRLEELSHLERKSLKNIFRLILRIQDLLLERYKSFII
jgi:CBS domain-containing protein